MNAAAERVNLARFFAPSILLDAGEAPANDNSAKLAPPYKWIHCANEGVYRGHHQGEFDLTRSVFDAFVRNFRDDPQYKAGTIDLGDGQSFTGGVKPVIQYDYEHASEMPPWEGSIASGGAPACGWVLDVEVRLGDNGKAQLWAFSQLGDQIRRQIAENQYRSVSIAFTLDGVHWVTGKSIGPVLTSIAFTNHPFMRDLQPLAAANRGAGQPREREVKRPPQSEAPGSTPTEGDRQMSELRERVCKALKIRVLQDDAAVAEAVEEAASGASDLKGLLEALGVSGAEDAMKAIPELQSARERVASLLAELDALLQQDMASDAEVANADVGAAMSAQRMQGDGAKKALGAFREKLVREELAKLSKDGHEPTLSQHRAARAEARKRFLTEYGINDPAKVQLSRPLVAGPGGQQVSSLPIDERADEGDRTETTIDLTNCRGRNTTERLIHYFTQKDQAFASLPIETQLARVHQARTESQLVINN
jgi:hypothetical protein